jgi:hypothetical protein
MVNGLKEEERQVNKEEASRQQRNTPQEGDCK